jgi:hypothetical protein
LAGLPLLQLISSSKYSRLGICFSRWQITWVFKSGPLKCFFYDNLICWLRMRPHHCRLTSLHIVMIAACRMASSKPVSPTCAVVCCVCAFFFYFPTSFSLWGRSFWLTRGRGHYVLGCLYSTGRKGQVDPTNVWLSLLYRQCGGFLFEQLFQGKLWNC